LAAERAAFKVAMPAAYHSVSQRAPPSNPAPTEPARRATVEE